ncbi:MAG: PD-(D/E)XK nuclease family protein [Prevotella sp.]|nr:PD-(D/E)XK nuclease family protein [Prevotella sp.]
MKSFLEYVAEDIIRKYGTDLSRTAVVFPNKRASLFLNHQLARIAQKPLWSPAYITISELFRQQSELHVADPIKLVCDLHQSFCLETGSDESLDKFYGWGQLLISDFDDIDKNMADPDRVFANLRDIHELDDLSYLTDEQRELLRHFFSHFTEEHETELKQRFLRLWSHFADIYHDFNRRLADQGLAYEGALYRQVVSAVCCDSVATDHEAFLYDRYIFVGFNLLQKVEQQLFSHLQREGKARFYWDFDHYYMQHHEAGRYIAQYLKYFPNELDSTDADIYGLFQSKKEIRYISAPTEHIQARYVSGWLREAERYKDGRRTAIVLCDEGLLPTVIHCLPSEVEKVNVTTGYPLAQTPIASFIQLYYDLILGGRTPRLLRAFHRHPYARFVDDTQPLLQMLRQIAQQAKDEIQDPLFQESLFRAYTLVNRLNALIESGDLQVTDQTLQRLTTQIIQQTSIPFHGEPIEGIQVMGVLETRNIDFDHVLLLSCNEGNMPRGVNDSSFIPHSIRQAYELTTVENKVSIYAYYFHRLLQRAKDVTILYNNATEDGQRGEMSRFMLQMLVESGQTISQHTLQTGQQTTPWTPQPIQKTPHVMEVLQSSFTTLSPTAVNRYLRCPLQFYYHYVAGLLEPNVPDDEQELDNRIFGTIFHEAADIIYHQLPRHITTDVLDHLLKGKIEIERAVDEAFHRVMPDAPIGGLHIINREVIIHYLRQLLQIDRRLAPFTILGLECDVYRPLTSHLSPLKIGGRIDRLDLICEDTPQERIRVIDYKTGSSQLRPLPDVESIFSPEKIHDHSDYYLQTFVYADIVRQKRQKPTSPALLFIQHAAADDYDPTLRFGREPILDIADHSQRFNELLDQQITQIFSPDVAFQPTSDLKTCRTCPYQQMCRR